MIALRLILPPPAWRPLLLLTALVLVPGVLEQHGSASGLLVVTACCGLGLLPLAVSLSHLVEQLVAQLGPRTGGLASVVMGNLVELLIAFNALAGGLYPLVVTSIAGAVMINCLPVLGLGIVVATRGRGAVAVDPHRKEIQNHQLLMSAILLALPAVFYQQPLSNALQGNNDADPFSLYSALVAVIALVYYVLAFLLHPGEAEPSPRPEPAPQSPPLREIVAALLGVSILIALVSERLVDSLETLVLSTHVSELFVGLFLLPLFGSLPEMLVTIKAASRRDMSLVMTNTVDSSLQLLLFVLPLLVLTGLPLNRHLHLGFPTVALASLAIAVVMIERITDNKDLTTFEGVQLILIFLAMALGSLLLTHA